MDPRRFSVVIEKDADGYYAFCPELQGCYTQGETYEEALANIRDAIKLHVAERIESGEGLPKLEMVSLTTVEVPNQNEGDLLRTLRSLKLEGPRDWSSRYEDYLYGNFVQRI